MISGYLRMILGVQTDITDCRAQAHLDQYLNRKAAEARHCGVELDAASFRRCLLSCLMIFLSVCC